MNRDVSFNWLSVRRPGTGRTSPQRYLNGIGVVGDLDFVNGAPGFASASERGGVALDDLNGVGRAGGISSRFAMDEPVKVTGRQAVLAFHFQSERGVEAG